MSYERAEASMRESLSLERYYDHTSSWSATLRILLRIFESALSMNLLA